jgi:hypothetical protein
MAERKPIFELHIRPMFRLLDRQHMLRVDPNLDLWDYDDVKAYSATILEKVKGPGPADGSRMPTENTGGAWPSEWISLFDRWIQGGFRRLSLGTAKNLTLQEDSELGVINLSCRTDVPATSDGRSIAWFENEFIPGAAITAYRLYVLPGGDLSAPPSTVEIFCGARVDRPIPQEGITVIDAAGTHTVNLPSA